MGGSANSLGDRMAQRMQYNAVISSTPILASVELGPNGFQAGQPFTLTITAPSPLPPPQTLTAQQTSSPTLTVPVTGLNMSGAEMYGGQYIAHITLKPGQSCTVTGTIPASDGTLAQPAATACATPTATTTPTATATAKPAATATAQAMATATAKSAANLIMANSGCPGVTLLSDPQLGPLQLNSPGNTPTMERWQREKQMAGQTGTDEPGVGGRAFGRHTNAAATAFDRWTRRHGARARR